MTQLDLLESHPPPGKGAKLTYTAEQVFAQAKAVRLTAKILGKKPPEWMDSDHYPNLNKITNRDVALFLPYLPGLRCRNLREVIKDVSMKRSLRDRRRWPTLAGYHAGWSIIPDKTKDRIAQAIWERKGRPVPCEGVTGALWGMGRGTDLGCRVYLSPTGRLFSTFEPPLTLVSWEEYMQSKPGAGDDAGFTEVGT